MLHKPSLLLLDEPTVGVDIGNRQAIISHVRKLCADEGLAVLWASHLIDEVADGDRLIVLHLGRILAAGGVRDVVRAAGASDVREAFTNLTEKAGRP